MTPLSALDLSFVTTQTPPSKALAQTIELAKHLDGLGYKRLWLAEHHSLASIASSAPEIMIGQVAAVTRNIRVGSGGVMLTNHAPLMVAERFKLLEALFPGRIDLGLGRAPGTDQVTAFALRRKMEERQGDDFLERLQELMLWETGEFPEGHPFKKVFAMPTDAPLPPIWLLGSSDYSARLAAQIGAGFSFAAHFSDLDPAIPMRLYRESFKPSARMQKPQAILAMAVICADSDADADRLASAADLHFVRRAKGEYLPLASPEEAAAYPYTAIDRERIAHNRRRLIVGGPKAVHERLSAAIAATQADELMITTMVHDHEARKRSYALLAEMFGLQPAT